MFHRTSIYNSHLSDRRTRGYTLHHNEQKIKSPLFRNCFLFATQHVAESIERRKDIVAVEEGAATLAKEV